MEYQQATRALQITTPFGPDQIQLIGFEGSEEISRLSEFQLELISHRPSLAAAAIVGQNVTFSFTDTDGSTRYFNGFVSRFAAGQVNDDGVRRYRAVVVPWLWFLTQTSDCRIFQDKTVVEIVEQIFTDLGFQDFDTSQITGNHPTREYCVQYRESDFDFVSRLLEEEGIFYFFDHEHGKHTLILADQVGAHQDVEQASVDYPSSDHYTWSLKPHLYSWESSFEFRTGRWAHTDYNFKSPRTKLMASETGGVKIAGAERFEAYDFPGEYAQRADGDPLAKIRAEELACQHHLVDSSSTCVSFVPGGRFKIGRHRIEAEQGNRYVIKSVSHQAFLAEAYESNGIPYQSDQPIYQNRLVCFPESIPFRPARTTKRPTVRGCQTAVVTGPPGEEIYPDEFGRVKVQFHWDREGQYDDKSSCWIRVSQIHAGKGWGYMDLPRIGEEVIVDFLEGNPDQPIIVGRVYNGDNPPPFALPDGKTRRGNKTKTYKGGGFNEMSMDDTPGKEQIRIHGQYNMDTEVQNDETHTIHNNRTKTIDVDETMSIGNNQKLDVGVNQNISVGTNQSTSVGSNQSNSVGMMKNETVGVMSNEMVGVVKTTNVGAAYSILSGAATNTAVGFIKAEQVGMNKSTTVGSEYKISAGSKFVIACGASQITMEAGGKITIKGSEIHIDGGSQIKAVAGVIDLN